MDWGAAQPALNVAGDTSSIHGFTDRVRVAFAETALSCTANVTSYEPVVDGVPLMRPSVLKLRPAGKDEADHEYGGTPPDTSRL